MASRSKPAQVTIVDVSATFRRGLRSILEEAGFSVREEAGGDPVDTASSVAIIVTVKSEGDVALLDGLRPSGVPVVALLHDADLPMVMAALRSGCAAILPWSSRPETIVAAVTAIRDGLVMLPAQAAEELAARVPVSTGAVLDDREVRWLQFLADGTTVARLADEVGYSEREMFRLLAEIYQRLGATNRSEALVKATRLGLLQE